MGFARAMEALSEFVVGELSIMELNEAIDGSLLELRQNPEMTEEKERLSKIQLFLHEVLEDLRPESDLTVLIQSTLRSTFSVEFSVNEPESFFWSSTLPPTVRLTVDPEQRPPTRATMALPS